MHWWLLCELIVLFVLIFSVVASISANLNSVPVLNGANFKDWKENKQIILGCMDLDLALRIEKPLSPTDSSTSEQRKLHEKRDHSNRMSLMIIKHDILEVFRGIVWDDITSGEEFLVEIEKRFEKGIRWKQVLSFRTWFPWSIKEKEMSGNTLWECQILHQN